MLKKIILWSRFLLLALVFLPSVSASDVDTNEGLKAEFDSALAEQLGGDEYGMKSYVLVILKTGPNDDKIVDKEIRSKIFQGHFANMNRLAKSDLLVLAGPLMNDKPKRGLLIFNVKTIAEAEVLVKTDPAVEAGIFIYEMTEYYGSAALMQINKTHQRIQKTKI